jgi:hypothetical protein
MAEWSRGSRGTSGATSSDVPGPAGHSTGHARRSGRSRCSGHLCPRVETFSSRFLPLRHQVGVLGRSDRRFRPSDVYSGCACDGSGPGGGRLSCCPHPSCPFQETGRGSLPVVIACQRPDPQRVQWSAYSERPAGRSNTRSQHSPRHACMRGYEGWGLLEEPKIGSERCHKRGGRS